MNHSAAFESWHCACAGLQPKPIHVSVSGREQHQSDKRPLRQASSHQVNFLSSNRKPQNCITTTTTSLSSNVTQQKKDCQQEEKVSGIHAQPILMSEYTLIYSCLYLVNLNCTHLSRIIESLRLEKTSEVVQSMIAQLFSLPEPH